MDIYMPMSTTRRHNKITTSFSSILFNSVKRKEVNILQEECALVHYGTKKLPSGFELINIYSIEDEEYFCANTILELDYVNPDFVLFKDNPYLENKKQTRTAGQPDLIVEVWSEANTDNDKAFLQNLYATSPITEHWYIEQDSNSVQCYVGKERISDQNLKDVLRTQKGLEFDLRYLAI